MHRLNLQPHLRPGDACSWREWNMSGARSGIAHAHRFRELFWILAGRGVHEVNGQCRELRPRMLVFVHEDDEHQTYPLRGESLRFVNLAFPLPAWRELRARYWRGQNDPFDAPLAARERRLGEAAWRSLNAMEEELRSGQRGRAAMDRFLLNVHHLIEARASERAGAALPHWLSEALQAMRRTENLAEGLPAFLRLCGRSREHVARLTRSLLGETPTDLVNTARLELAAEELAGSDRPILEISLACGFGHLGHFYKEFVRRYHTTPRCYRREHQWLIRAE